MSRIRKIINLVDGVSPVNFGIWHAAVASSSALSKDYGIESFLVSPTIDNSFHQDLFPAVKTIQLESVSKDAAVTFFKDFNPEETIAVDCKVKRVARALKNALRENRLGRRCPRAGTHLQASWRNVFTVGPGTRRTHGLVEHVFKHALVALVACGRGVRKVVRNDVQTGLLGIKTGFGNE